MLVWLVCVTGFQTPIHRVSPTRWSTATNTLYAPPTPPTGVSAVRVLGAATLLCGIDEAARFALGAAVPHSLVAGALLVLALVGLGDRGGKAHDMLLAPGAALVLQWMPAFFVPALVALPLTSPVASTARDAAGILFVVVAGLFATLTSTALVVSRVGRSDAPAPAKVASPATLKFPSSVVLAASMAATAALAASRVRFAGAFFVATTLATFVASTRLAAFLKSPRRPVALATAAQAAHPVVVCAGLTSAFVQLYAMYARMDPLLAVALYCTTAGAWLQRLLGPAVLALACGIYARRVEVVASWRELIAGVSVGVGSGMYATALLGRLLNLPNDAKLALIPRCVTTPLALPICDSLNANPGAAVAGIVATGVLGAATGPAFLNKLGLHDEPKARGLAMGAAAHGIGTAQLANEPNAQPYASMALSLCGAASVLLAAAPPSRSLLLWLAGI